MTIQNKILNTLWCFILLTGCYNDNDKDKSDVNIIKPNVILIITDDQGYGDIGAHGNIIIKTPHIDNLYQESTHLTNFHVSPTCAPTRSGLMTGRHANSTGVWHTVGGWSLLRENEKTIANMFSEAGYKTGAFGKWHLGDNYSFRPENRGFQETVIHKGGGVQQTPDYWNNTYFNDTYFHNGKPKKYQGYCTDVFFKEAIDFIKRNKDNPFFCYIAPNAPHGPYNVPPEYYNIYKNLADDVINDTQKRFYGMITNIDDNLGKLREKLSKLKIADNTILIFMTDNGTSAGYYNKKGKITGFNAAMRGTKGSEYEGGHRVPFFIHWKNGKIKTYKDINTLTAHIDIMPTLAELCGIKLPNNHQPLDGQSLVPLLRGKDTLKNRMLVTDSQRVQHPEKWKNCAVMYKNWRLINGKELYNIETDQGQKNDVAEDYPEKVTEMKVFYENWWTQVSKDFNEEIYLKIGSENENPITLTAHDIHGESGKYPWNQIHIRKGTTGTGYWNINVVKSGIYQVSLRRYPKESNLIINTSSPTITKDQLHGLEKDIPEGKNLNYVKATIEFENQLKTEKIIKKNDISATFKVPLTSGKTKFWANFIDSNNKPNTVYYAYIKNIE